MSRGGRCDHNRLDSSLNELFRSVDVSSAHRRGDAAGAIGVAIRYRQMIHPGALTQAARMKRADPPGPHQSNVQRYDTRTETGLRRLADSTAALIKAREPRFARPELCG